MARKSWQTKALEVGLLTTVEDEQRDYFRRTKANEEFLAMDFNFEKVKMALIGDPDVSPADGMKALAFLKLYIARLHSDLNSARQEVDEYQELIAKTTPKR